MIPCIFTFNVFIINGCDRWILARYDVDVLDYEKNQAVVDIAPLNKGVDILEFDYSRKEVEVCQECVCTWYSVNNLYTGKQIRYNNLLMCNHVYIQ